MAREDIADTLLSTDRTKKRSGTTPRDCPDEEQLLAFTLGAMDMALYPEIESHFDHCASCFELITAMARHSTGADAQPGARGAGNELSVRGAGGAVADPAAGEPLGREYAAGDCEDESVPGGNCVWDATYGDRSVLANRFDIARFIDRGGMGEVYEAFDRDLREKVAVKTMLSSLSETPFALSQLREEVKLARRVAHPNVCRVHDLHLHEDRRRGRPPVRFLAMEYIEGRTLKKMMAQGALSIERASGIARQLLAGLGAAHSAGVLHLDFKSQNVMLRAANVEPEVAIMDFGLSRALDVEARLRTSERRVAGSAGYMAPEQIQCRPVGPASDLYSFGVVLFEMLTGQLPFDGSSAASVMMQQLKGRAPAPTKVRKELPAVFDEFVLKCLQRNPRARFESVDAARLAFERCLESLRSPQAVLSARRRAVGAVSVSGLVLATAGWLFLPTGPTSTTQGPSASPHEQAIAPLEPGGSLTAVAPLGVAPFAAPAAVPFVIPDGARPSDSLKDPNVEKSDAQPSQRHVSKEREEPLAADISSKQKRKVVPSQKSTAVGSAKAPEPGNPKGAYQQPEPREPWIGDVPLLLF